MGSRGMFYGAKPRIFSNAKELRDRETSAEKMLWKRLSKNQLKGFKFRRQHPMSCFIADFYCHKAKLVIELDGEIHDLAENKEYDAGRDHAMKELGLKVLRFTNNRVFSDIDGVLCEIEQYLNECEVL